MVHLGSKSKKKFWCLMINITTYTNNTHTKFLNDNEFYLIVGASQAFALVWKLGDLKRL
ncbi:hypothetical protein ACJX0J_028125, partial [Zea mays]